MTAEGDRPVVLVWADPAQPGEDVRRLLADVSGDLVVARWDPGSDDGGRTELLTSVRRARDRITAMGGDADQLSVVGFGHGAVAAAGLARHAKRLGIGLGPVVAVAGTWHEPDPFSGAPVEEVPERVELVDDASQVAAAISDWGPR